MFPRVQRVKRRHCKIHHLTAVAFSNLLEADTQAILGILSYLCSFHVLNEAKTEDVRTIRTKSAEQSTHVDPFRICFSREESLSLLPPCMLLKPIPLHWSQSNPTVTHSTLFALKINHEQRCHRFYFLHSFPFLI